MTLRAKKSGLLQTQHVQCTYSHTVHVSVLKIVFESVQQKHLDKTLFDQQAVDFDHKRPHKPALYTFMAHVI